MREADAVNFRDSRCIDFKVIPLPNYRFCVLRLATPVSARLKTISLEVYNTLLQKRYFKFFLDI